MVLRLFSESNIVHLVKLCVLKFLLVRCSNYVSDSEGLIDEGETPEATAERELREETGYHGKATHTSYLMHNGISLRLQANGRPWFHEHEYECCGLRCGYE